MKKTLSQKIAYHERELARHENRLYELYRQANNAEEIKDRLSAISERIGKIEDAIANAADREFGWENWRRKKSIGRKVIARMIKATAQQRAKRNLILAEVGE